MRRSQVNSAVPQLLSKLLTQLCRQAGNVVRTCAVAVEASNAPPKAAAYVHVDSLILLLRSLEMIVADVWRCRLGRTMRAGGAHSLSNLEALSAMASAPRPSASFGALEYRYRSASLQRSPVYSPVDGSERGREKSRQFAKSI